MKAKQQVLRKCFRVKRFQKHFLKLKDFHVTTLYMLCLCYVARLQPLNSTAENLADRVLYFLSHISDPPKIKRRV